MTGVARERDVGQRAGRLVKDRRALQRLRSLIIIVILLLSGRVVERERVVRGKLLPVVRRQTGTCLVRFSVDIYVVVVVVVVVVVERAVRGVQVRRHVGQSGHGGLVRAVHDGLNARAAHARHVLMMVTRLLHAVAGAAAAAASATRVEYLMRGVLSYGFACVELIVAHSVVGHL